MDIVLLFLLLVCILTGFATPDTLLLIPCTTTIAHDIYSMVAATISALTHNTRMVISVRTAVADGMSLVVIVKSHDGILYCVTHLLIVLASPESLHVDECLDVLGLKSRVALIGLEVILLGQKLHNLVPSLVKLSGCHDIAGSYVVLIKN
jgi:hypothetical protein